MSSQRIAFSALWVWIVSTMAWWILAFWPVSTNSQQWLIVAKDVCFGSVEDGLPSASGWLMLVGAPLSLLLAAVLIWPREIQNFIPRLLSFKLGQILIVTTCLVLLLQIYWTAGQIQKGLVVAGENFESSLSGALPSSYPQLNKAAVDFELTNQRSESVRLSENSDLGKVSIVSFAFSNCQTICPSIVNQLKKAVRDIDPEKLSLFVVTIDPRRDTVSSLAAWAESAELPSNAHLLTGSVEAVEKVLSDYEVPFRRNEQNGDVDHPPLTYIIDQEFKQRFLFGNVPPTWIAQAVQGLLQNQPQKVN